MRWISSSKQNYLLSWVMSLMNTQIQTMHAMVSIQEPLIRLMANFICSFQETVKGIFINISFLTATDAVTLWRWPSFSSIKRALPPEKLLTWLRKCMALIIARRRFPIWVKWLLSKFKYSTNVRFRCSTRWFIWMRLISTWDKKQWLKSPPIWPSGSCHRGTLGSTQISGAWGSLALCDWRLCWLIPALSGTVS